MENFSYAASYPESGDSSPRSREIDFENPPPWEDQQPSNNNYKVKFMCSYGGKIHPRPHDNQLSYIGGETKILAFDRNIKFSPMISKLSALCDADVSFKYQLPGEDLDALISVTNDEDLDHMMHEYDRLCRASAKPARLRLFLFPANPLTATASASSFGSNEARSDRERFVDALNSGPIQSSTPPSTVAVAPPDFLFGLEKGMPPPVAAMKVPVQISDRVASEREVPVPSVEDRAIGSDQVQMQIPDMQRLQIGGQEQAMYRRKSDDNLVGGYPGDYYYQKMPEKMPPATSPATVPSTMTVPTGYWTEKQTVTGAYPATTIGTDQQQVYMIPAPAGMYHAPPPPQMGRPMNVQASQGYYAVQRMPSEVYREQSMYNVMPQMATAPTPTPAAAPPTLPPQAPPPQKVAAYPDGIGMVRTPSSGGVVTDNGYAQMAYDSAMQRHVFYNAPGGVVPPPQYHQPVGADMRPAGGLNQEGKVVAKVSQASV